MLNNYLINYNVFTKSGNYFNKQIRVKNKENELFAKVGLENYLRKKYSDFERLEIISCKIDFTSLLNQFTGDGDLFNFFKAK